VAWDFDVNTGKDLWIGDLRGMFGIESDRCVVHVSDFYDSVHPEDRRQVAEAVAHARTTHSDYYAEFRIVRRDNETRWVSARGSFSYSKAGLPERMTGVAMDVTGRKLTQEALAKSQEKFAKAFRQSPMWLAISRARDHVYVEINETFEKATGWRREEVIGKTALDLNLWLDPPQRRRIVEEVVTHGHIRDWVDQYRRKDGRPGFALESAELIDIEGERCILSAIIDITERKVAEEQLQRKKAELLEAQHLAKIGSWEWNPNSGTLKWSDELYRIHGLEPNSPLPPLEECGRFFSPESWTKVQDSMREIMEVDTTRELDLELVLPDGNRRWVVTRAQAIRDSDGGTICLRGTTQDITDRKLAEQAHREGEERFRLVADTAPVKIWMSGTDKLCTYVNKRWLDFRGRSLDAELGNGWAQGLHPDDVDRCLETYHTHFEARIPFKMEYRLLRHDGEYRWVIDSGVPRFNGDGRFAGYIGSVIDVTERKTAEEALGSIGRRLIEAHEEERAWIGRELHDDVNQRLALLAVELDNARQQLPSSRAVEKVIQHAQERIAEIAKDVQGLSHRLHSSKLDYLGLVAAASSFCRDITQQSKVHVDFSHRDIPRALPKEVSLCLFRVLQEALQNAVKHSGGKQFRVTLARTREGLELIVADDGAGFDLKKAASGKGLGLISMRERLQLVEGKISIHAKPGTGTTVRALVRLEEEPMQAIAS
jgi:PAS domain S-box-containing protein